MLILLPCRRRMRLPRAKRDRDGLSCLSERSPNDEPARSSETIELSVEVMEEPGERREEVEVVVLLLERPLKTDRRLGLLAWAMDLERICAACSGCSLDEFVDGRSLPSSLSQDLSIGGGKVDMVGSEREKLHHDKMKSGDLRRLQRKGAKVERNGSRVEQNEVVPMIIN